MKKLLCTILSLTLLLTGCTIGNGNIRIGAAGIGGMYYTFANTLAGLCTKEDTGFELEVKRPQDLPLICVSYPAITSNLVLHRQI